MFLEQQLLCSKNIPCHTSYQQNKMLYIIQFLSAHTRMYVSARAVVRVCARVYVYTLLCHVVILQTVHCKRTEEVV